MSQYRLKIAEYFDELVRSIDLLFCEELNKNSENEAETAELNADWEELVRKAREVENFNLSELEKVLALNSKNDLENMTEMELNQFLLKQFCFMLTIDGIKRLIVTDVYFSPDQIVNIGYLILFSNQKLQETNFSDLLLFLFNEGFSSSLLSTIRHGQLRSLKTKFEIEFAFFSNLENKNASVLEFSSFKLFKIESMKISYEYLKELNPETMVLFKNIEYFEINSLQIKIDSNKNNQVTFEKLPEIVEIFLRNSASVGIMVDLRLKADNHQRLIHLNLNQVIDACGFQNRSGLKLFKAKYGEYDPKNNIVCDIDRESAVSQRQILEILDLSYMKNGQVYKDAFQGLLLKELCLKYPLKFDPGAFNGLWSLKVLHMNECNLTIKQLENGLLDPLENLEVLSIVRCKLTNWKSSDWLKKLSCLRSLDLSFNRIKSLNNHMFADVTELEKLNLSINKISRVEVNAFYSLSKLRFLHLDRNRISKFEDGTFDTLRDLV